MPAYESPASDDLHTPHNDDPWFTETAWYSFWTTDAAFAMHVYLRFRPNLGIADSSVYVWERGSSVPWDAAYWKQVHCPMPDSLSSMKLLGGIEHQQMEPFRSYRLGFADGSGYRSAIAAEVLFDAIDPPIYFGGKHFDQPGRVTGALVYDGIEHAVDCFAFRDRSWYSRSDFRLFRSAYSYVIPSPDTGFLVLTAAPRDADLLVSDVPVVGGHVMREGRRVGLVSGWRRVLEREPGTGRPLRLGIEAVDENGVALIAQGEATHALALAANANMLSWMSIVDWTADGITARGEDQEIWSPSLFRAYRKGGETRGTSA